MNARGIVTMGTMDFRNMQTENGKSTRKAACLTLHVQVKENQGEQNSIWYRNYSGNNCRSGQIVICIFLEDFGFENLVEYIKENATKAVTNNGKVKYTDVFVGEWLEFNIVRAVHHNNGFQDDFYVGGDDPFGPATKKTFVYKKDEINKLYEMQSKKSAKTMNIDMDNID